MSPAVAVADIPTVSVRQMREVDRIMVEDLGIQLLQMMENAGRALAGRARVMLGGDTAGRRVTVLAGSGGNGGGGMVAGRRLALWGADVTVVLAQPAESMTGVPAQQLAILERIGVPVHGPGSQLPAADLLLDALIGYSLTDAPRPPGSSLIRAANGADTPILALDIPSGLDGDRGPPYDPCIMAAATLILALPKTGLLQPYAETHVGELYLADISVPPSVYNDMGLRVGDIFGRDDVVALR
ncbi:MAG: NAD(P)H-hydrate epimerase [Actinomycetota bacterium]|nr:NAD(P)H-hydrate epimerase [Actinomycetota bacterium]